MTSTLSMTDQLKDVLAQYWGYDGFLPLQERAMRSVVDNRDTVVVLPTGGGKSLCYQAPALCRDGLAVVVSPLISLMKDQVDALQACGVPAACVNSQLSISERQRVAEEVRCGRLKLLYLSPERLVADKTIDFLAGANVSFVAIDEAHCISEWGHDFRPEYRMLRQLKQRLPGVSVHAYTATATEPVREDIARQLGLDDADVLVGSFDRPNLSYKVLRRESVFDQVRGVIDRHPGDSGIVYCIRRADVDTLTADLCAAGYKARPYHAGLSDAERQRNQDAFIREQADVIVATVAFGMGIDKSNVRYIVHAGMPKSLESYQQESGRAGRDGLEAECVLLYSGGDPIVWKKMLKGLPETAYEAAMKSLNAMEEFCTGAVCRHRVLLKYFGQTLDKESCEACDICLGDVETIDDPLIVAQKILSCVVRLKERFGADYTAKVLTASKEKRILEQKHDELSTYGILSDESKTLVRHWIEQLVGLGFLAKTGDYSVLQVTPTGRRVLSGDETPRLTKPLHQTDDAQPGDEWEGVDRGLFDALRELRREQAEARDVPAYVIFGDAALRDMARRRPSTLDGMGNVKGVGAKKLEDFGDMFAGLINHYCSQHNLPQDVEVSTPAPAPPRKSRAPSPNARKAYELFAQNKTVAEVAETLRLAESTVTGFLNEHLRRSGTTDPTPWVPLTVADRIESAANSCGLERLKPIFEALEGTVDYNTLRIVVTCLRNRAGDRDAS